MALPMTTESDNPRADDAARIAYYRVVARRRRDGKETRMRLRD